MIIEYILFYFIFSLFWCAYIWYSTVIPDVYKVLILSILWPYHIAIKIAGFFKKHSKRN